MKLTQQCDNVIYMKIQQWNIAKYAKTGKVKEKKKEKKKSWPQNGKREKKTQIYKIREISKIIWISGRTTIKYYKTQ